MKQKQMTAIAIGCGAACALCVGVFMASVQGQADAARAEALARYGGEQVEVCVATRDIAAGERVDLSAVETKLWVADLLPEDAVRANADAIGKTATSSILKGEVVSGKRFESTRDALEIPSGKEAVSVPAKAVQAVGGAVRPGMSVDVYASGNTETTAIARSVLVLATSVGESGSLVSSDSGWITLAVAPESVQEIIAASNTTNLHFVIPGGQVEGAEE
ncbi:MAG: Flp pilus assembly protein CpaB [Eggerthellaceae bacterium]|nr:Flp pilus assembly protein CpaB [Eggerthellaceae bacterium]